MILSWRREEHLFAVATHFSNGRAIIAIQYEFREQF